MPEAPYGLIATFDNTGALYRAAEKVRDAGYRQWDCITPLPVHGLDKAMGQKRSIVPRISLCGGITGFCTGMSLIFYGALYTAVYAFLLKRAAIVQNQLEWSRRSPQQERRRCQVATAGR